ncbi:putative insecticidal toxin [Apophysomyces sp. BC1034]|nr:putative insecticidal toxin [Apophysomyces sp. BC1034]
MRRALRGRVIREEVYGVDNTRAAAHPYTVSQYRYQVREVPDTSGARVLLPMQLEQLNMQYERAPEDPMSTHQVLLAADRYGHPTDTATVHYPRRVDPTTPAEYNDPQQGTLRVTRTQQRLIHLDEDHWRLGLPCETQTTVLQPHADAGEWLDYELLSDGRLDIAPCELIGWQRFAYVNTECAELPFGQATFEGLLAGTCQAEVTLDALEHACKDLPSPGELDPWMTRAQYRTFDEEDNDYYWIDSPRAHYLDLSGFYRLSHQTDAFGAKTQMEYDASGYCVTCVTDALDHVMRADYDYRSLQPTCIIDANENRHEAAYDPLGRLRVSSFYGQENDEAVGFTPVKDYRTTIHTVHDALDKPADAIQQAAAVYYDDLSSWMGRFDDGTLDAGECATLQKLGLITADGGIRARCRWQSTAPQGVTSGSWEKVKRAIAAATRISLHSAVLTHDDYLASPRQQIRCAATFTDGFGRVLQSKQRVAEGSAWVANPDGTLKLCENRQPVTEKTTSRWAVSGRVEYNNKGLAVRQYRPYFINTHRYVNDASMRQFGYHDLCYYDLLGRNTRVITAAGYEQRTRFDVWFDAHEDENDTSAGSGDVCYETPTISVRDNRGLTVRQVQYNRTPGNTEPQEKPQILITRHVFDASGALQSSEDPRHFAANQGKSQAEQTLNFKYLSTLSGQVLRTDSVDAGTRVQLNDARGLTAWAASSNGHQHEWRYDALGRPTARFEQLKEPAVKACRERFVYGEANSQPGHNLRGRLIRHWDPVGLSEVSSYALTGQPLSETRSFLRTLDEPDWPEEEDVRIALLEPEHYVTRWTYNALGETATHTDAGGHRRRFESDIAGQPKMVWLQLVGQDERCVASDFMHNAMGQPLQVRTGNGMIRTYTYEAKTQRLQCLCSQRVSDNTVLQNLSYTYDPVGNITRIEDAAQPVRYTRNQRVEAASTYQYDALYQLIEATGRESTQAGQQGAVMPPWQNLDATQRVNYTRQYTYDTSSNLRQMQHTGAQNYTLRMTVAAGSNRAVPESWDVVPEQVNRYFDANCNLTQLQPGQLLAWNVRDQLSRVVQIHRDEGDDDDERYAYRSRGQRSRKQRRWHAGSQQHTEDVRYLSSLEQREHRQSSTDNSAQATVTEALQVIMVDAGGIALRILHWEAGKPDAIHNDQARYSFDNHLGSSTLELDSAAQLLTYEEYYPYGCTSLWAAKSEVEAKYKYVRYSGKERDATGLYYYGFRYYIPWLGRWLNTDPARTAGGFNLFQMVRNNPVNFYDRHGLFDEEVEIDNIRNVTTLFEESTRKFISENFVTSSRLSQPDFLKESNLDAAAKEGRAVEFSLFKYIYGDKSFVSLEAGKLINESSKNLVGSVKERGSVLAYWVPQGGYTDVPVKPDPAKNEEW